MGEIPPVGCFSSNLWGWTCICHLGFGLQRRIPNTHQPVKSLARFVCTLSLLLGVWGKVWAPVNPVLLTDALDAIIQAPGLDTAFWGVYVQDLETGTVLYQHNADRGLIPASNQKLLTTAAALDALGAGYRYETTLYFSGTRDGGTWTGDLILKGSGDPTFGSSSIDADPLEGWAGELAHRGVRTLRGRLIGDDNVFDDEPYAPGWDVQAVTTEAYAPPIAGLAYRDNLVDVVVRGGSQSGRRPNVKLEPVPHLEIENRASVSQRRRRGGLQVHRELGSRTATLTGTVPRRRTRRLRLPAHNPTHFALETLLKHLRAAGIDAELTVVDVDDLTTLPNYAAAEPLLVHHSPSLRQITRVINQRSDNLYAEQLFRTMGWGRTAGGARRVQQLLLRAGVKADQARVRDGSGLSRKNLVTARALGQVLAFMDLHPEREVFYNSLAPSGQGTLSRRLSGVPVRAKTGTLEHVRSLSGYVTAKDGTPLSFVILANHFSVRARDIRQAQDRMVRVLASYPQILP